MPSLQPPGPSAFILGIDTPAGAYLARLLHARGQHVSGAAAQGPSLLPALGAQEDITELTPADFHTADTHYIIAQSHSQADSLADHILAAAPQSQRLIHVVDEELLRTHAPARARLKALATRRLAGGHFAANAVLHPHDSRLGPVTSLPARLSITAFRAAQQAADPQSVPPVPPESENQSWGWTPEYVDAVARLATLPTATDIQISSGVPLSAEEMARHAADFFKLPPNHAVRALSQNAPQTALPPSPHPERLKSLLGWRAYTTGADLMAALCEAAAERAARAGNGR